MLGRHEDNTELFAAMDKSLAGVADENAILRAEELVFRRRGTAAVIPATAGSERGTSTSPPCPRSPRALKDNVRQSSPFWGEPTDVTTETKMKAAAMTSGDHTEHIIGRASSPVSSPPRGALLQRTATAGRGKTGTGSNISVGNKGRGHTSAAGARRLPESRRPRSKSPPPLPPRPAALSRMASAAVATPELTPKPELAVKSGDTVPSVTFAEAGDGGAGGNGATNLILLDGLRLVWTLEIRDGVVSYEKGTQREQPTLDFDSQTRALADG